MKCLTTAALTTLALTPAALSAQDTYPASGGDVLITPFAGASVQIDHRASGGRVIIRYHSLEELEGIVDHLV